MRLDRDEEARRNPERYLEGYPLLELISDTEAAINTEDLARLPEYSTSIPTGVCVGKVWKAKARRADGWLLGSFEDCDPPEQDACLTRFRVLHVRTPREAQVLRALRELVG